VFRKWKFRGGGGHLHEIPSVVGVWIFSGTTQSDNTTLCLSSLLQYKNFTWLAGLSLFQFLKLDPTKDKTSPIRKKNHQSLKFSA